MTDFKKFKEQLPSKEKFYSSLTGKKISNKEYDYVLKVWKRFEMKTMKDYHDLYLKRDVLLLAHDFENYKIIASRIMDYVPLLFESTSLKFGCNV